MSYSIQDAKIEFESKVDDVLQTRDVEGAYELAKLLKTMGDDEEANMFVRMANRWEEDNWAHDRANDN